MVFLKLLFELAGSALLGWIVGWGVHDLFLGSISGPVGASDFERKRISDFEKRAGTALKMAGAISAVVVRIITLLPIKIW